MVQQDLRKHCGSLVETFLAELGLEVLGSCSDQEAKGDVLRQNGRYSPEILEVLLMI